LTETKTKPRTCQVRIDTEDPCRRSAEVVILGVAFCGPCAREQEAYFAIGELTHEEGQDLRGKPLAEVLERKRRERAAATREDHLRILQPAGLYGLLRRTPSGVTAEDQSWSTVVLAALMYGLGLSCSAASHLLGALGAEISKTSVWRDAQQAGEALREKRPAGKARVLGRTRAPTTPGRGASQRARSDTRAWTV
jgi:hypothetical protein